MAEHKTYNVSPDEVPAVIEYLEASTRLAALVPDFVVAGDLHGWHKPEVRITVETTGGSFLGVRTAQPRLDINVYAPSKVLAKRVALATAAELRGFKNTVTGDSVIIGSEPSYPQDLTDLLNENPRFVFDLQLQLRKK